MMRVLVVDDEPQLMRALRINLSARRYEVVVAADGAAALEAAARHLPDLVILDLGLPDMDGTQVIAGLRGWTQVPILVLSGRTDASDKVEALDAGADDYMTKPFSMRELAARVNVLLRRVERAQLAARTPVGGSIRLGELEIDHVQRRVRVAGADVHLTPTEFDLLACLAQQPRAVLTREQLLAEVWDWTDASGTRTVDSHVKALRRKIGANWIRTVHGVGYALEAPTP
jgi:DNA-binding response OmpR family regulator